MSNYIDIPGIGAQAEAEAAKVETPEVKAKVEEAPAEKIEEKKVETAEAKTEAEPTGTEDDEGTEDEHKRKSGSRKLRERLQAEREARIRLEARLEALEGNKTQPIAVTLPAGKPDPEKFETQAAYLEALTDWKVGQTMTEREAKAKETREKDVKAKSDEDWSKKLDKAHKDHPDLAELLDEAVGIPVTPAMDAMFRESEQGGDLLHYLVAHPEESRRIAGLTHNRQIVELGRLELTLADKGKAEVKSKKETHAPAPVVPLGGSSTVTPPKNRRDTYVDIT